MEKEIIILTKSNKHSNYCISGIDTKTGKWVRPVSTNSRLEGAVLVNDVFYQDGTEVELLDIVKIKFVEHSPNKAQNENYIYDDTYYWEKIGKSSIQEIIEIRGLDDCPCVFSNNLTSLCDDDLTGQSLLLLKIIRPSISIKTFPDNRRIQINFVYNGESYRYINISDIRLLNKYENKPDGNYGLGDWGVAVFSLTGKYEKTGKYYKMLAQLF